MGAKQSKGVVLRNQVSNSPTTSSTSSLQVTHQLQVQGETNVIVCQETQSNGILLCAVVNYFPKAPNFDTSTAKNHQGLTSFLDGGKGSGGEEVDRKFSEAHKKLQKGHVNTCFWIVPIVIVTILGSCAVAYLQDQHKVQCRATKVCNSPNLTIGGIGECPTISDWADDCCYALCNIKHYSVVHDGKGSWNGDWVKDCRTDNKINEKLAANQPLKLECNCGTRWNYDHRTGLKTEQYFGCDEAKVYGDFKHLPGFYASPQVTTAVSYVCYLLSILIVMSAYFYAWYRTKQIDGILQNHFQDWKDRGINVEYHRPYMWLNMDGCKPDIAKVEGRIVITLPPWHVTDPPPQACYNQPKHVSFIKIC